LEAQCLVEKYIAEIVNNIHKYIIPRDGKIGNEIFVNYCHSQKLRINPNIVFNYLSRNN
jgi:hypothetical protein